VIILSYAHAGAESLASVLSASRSLACTSGIGLLPLCHLAAATWQRAENRNSAPSPLAIKSIRAMAGTMITVIQAETGGGRWCETAFAGPEAATTFLQVFPASTFLCQHRSLPAVLADGLGAYPWGLGGSPFWPHSGGHPGNNIATIATYWATNTELLLNFENDQPASCFRTRHEDLAAGADQEARSIYARLGLDPADLAAVREPRDAAPVAVPDADTLRRQIPSRLLAKISELSEVLGYPPVA
jgi:hypothetical protein